MPGIEDKYPLHTLLYKIQDQIARTGTCASSDIEAAKVLLSSKEIRLEDKDDKGCQLKQIILGQNRWNNTMGSCLPPIIPLATHPAVIKAIPANQIKSMELVPLHQHLGGMILKSLTAGLGVGTITALIIGGLVLVISVATGLAEGAGILAGITLGADIALGMGAMSEAVGALLGLTAAGSTTYEIIQARKAGYQYLSLVALGTASEPVTSVPLDATFEQQTKSLTPTKQQKMVALAMIKQIEDPLLRREMLRVATGAGIRGKEDPLYKFFSYQRGFKAASAERGTLKLLHTELTETEKLFADSAKDKKPLSTDAYTQQVMAKERERTPIVAPQPRVAAPVSQARIYPDLADYDLLAQMPAVPTAAPVARAASASPSDEEIEERRMQLA